MSSNIIKRWILCRQWGITQPNFFPKSGAISISYRKFTMLTNSCFTPIIPFQKESLKVWVAPAKAFYHKDTYFAMAPVKPLFQKEV
jgi:hypothetical protein